jgi:5'-3' exonuclease
MEIDELFEDIENAQEVFLIDLSWVLYKSWYSYKDLTVDDRYTGHIYGVLRTIISMKKHNKDSVIILCKDGVPEERLEENEDYKAGREHDLKHNIWEDLDIIVKMALRLPGVYMAYNEKRESDDLLYALSKKIEKGTDEGYIYIHTVDNDLLQAISDRIFLLKKITNSSFVEVDKEYVMTNNSMIRNFRYCPVEKLPIYRSIIGDSSDNLDGLYRFPRKLATMIAEKSESIEDIPELKFSDFPKEEMKPSYKKHLKRCRENMDVIKSNYKMMNLSEDIGYNLWTVEGEKIAEEVDVLAEELKMSQYQDFLIASGLNDVEEIEDEFIWED